VSGLHHSHDHDHHHHDHRERSGASGQPRALRGALLFTGAFMVVEALVGFRAHSLALLADAGHMLGDAGALVLALLAALIAARPRTPSATFGYRRAEVLAAFANGVVLAVLAIVLLREAAARWLEPTAIDAPAVLGCAALGLAVNLWVARMLHRGAQHNLNMRAAMLHVLSDALGSVGVLISALLVQWFGWIRADAVTSVLIAVLIAWSGWLILKHTAGVLLESVPSGVDVQRVERCIASTPGVLGFHDLHVWRISDGFDVVSVHVTLQPDAHGVEVCRAVSARIATELGIDHVTVQPEAAPPNELVALRQSRDGPVVGG
jgi:cobalt-zinc-cadmium efflux system protein